MPCGPGAADGAQAANFPFCTIKPNVARVEVHDPRLDRLAALNGSAKCAPSQASGTAASLPPSSVRPRTVLPQLEFVDIAGLIEGAAKGAGLGNQCAPLAPRARSRRAHRRPQS